MKNRYREGETVRIVRPGDRNEGSYGVVTVDAELGNYRVLVGIDDYRWYWQHDLVSTDR